MKTTFIVIITFLFFISIRPNCVAQSEKDTLKILFVGNSYTYFGNLPQIISTISDDANTKLVTKKSTVGGAKLRDHWLGERGLDTKEMIADGEFDLVILQEYSMGTINEPDSLIKYSNLFCDFIYKNNAKPYFYLTWAREMVPQYQETINNVYLEASIENKAEIVPVGKAWALAKQLRPNIELYHADGSHPSELGTYLAACVFIASILDEIPGKLKGSFWTMDKYGESVQLMSVHPLDVVFCKKIAEEITSE
ncbi:MAG: hypothetical protein QNK30_14535 [Bacteroidales bacterium]|nr:hypothetical protein [Bacteroidales bacterium]